MICQCTHPSNASTRPMSSHSPLRLPAGCLSPLVEVRRRRVSAAKAGHAAMWTGAAMPIAATACAGSLRRSSCSRVLPSLVFEEQRDRERGRAIPIGHAVAAAEALGGANLDDSRPAGHRRPHTTSCGYRAEAGELHPAGDVLQAVTAAPRCRYRKRRRIHAERRRIALR